MPPLTLPDSLKAIQIGNTARGLLSREDCHGKVLAVVSNCIYLTDSQGPLLWLINEDAPMHARAVQCMRGLPTVGPELAYWVIEHKLIFPTGQALDLAQANPWQPNELPLRALPALEQVRQRAFGIYAELTRHSPRGFGEFISPILALTDRLDGEQDPFFGDPAAQVAWPSVQRIILGLAANDLAQFLCHANLLVGLGNGLTPSGDDFLGGLFFALHMLRDLYPSPFQFKQGDLIDFTGRLEARTNQVSLTILTDLAMGRAVAPLHEFCRCLALPQAEASALRQALALTGIGHSTGWDLLSGVLAGLRSSCCEREMQANPASPALRRVGSIPS